MHSTQPDSLTTLNQLCHSVIPELKGSLWSPQISSQQQVSPQQQVSSQQQVFTGTPTDQNLIPRLYEAIQAATPEARKPYWLIRTWDSLTWQPVYVSLIAIYGMQQLPDLSGFKQHFHGTYIAGYSLESPEFFQAGIPELIEIATRQLIPVLNHYRQLLDNLIRCRQGMTEQLIADLLCAGLQQLQRIAPHWHHQQIIQQAKLWLDALAFPLSSLDGFAITQAGELSYTRRSCCLVYQTKHGTLCENCPRHQKKEKRRIRMKDTSI